jgi:hypothetical protein
MVERRLWRTRAKSAKRPDSLMAWRLVGGSGGGIDAGEGDNGGFAHGVIDENAVAFGHGADGLDGLGVGDAVPGGFQFFFEIGNAVGFRIGLGEVVAGGRHGTVVIFLCSKSS